VSEEGWNDYWITEMILLIFQDIPIIADPGFLHCIVSLVEDICVLSDIIYPMYRAPQAPATPRDQGWSVNI